MKNITTAAKVGNEGLAHLVLTEGRQMDADQYIRELVVNVAQNGGDQLVIDGWTSPDGRTLHRFSDNACGMTERGLLNHIGTILNSAHGTGNNFGWGSRVATLAHNPAGVDYASRTAEGESMMRVHFDGKVMGARRWELEGGQVSEVVDPDPGMLERVDLLKADTGTAVILNGEGRGDTYNSSIAHKCAVYLANKFFEYPATSTGRPLEVRVQLDAHRRVLPYGERLMKTATASDVMEFDAGGYSGRIWWAVIPKVSEQGDKITGALTVPPGAGFMNAGELFYLDKTKLDYFGIPYASVKAQVVILVEVDNSEMTPARDGLAFYRDGSATSKAAPWRVIGNYFADNMPDPIQNLIDGHSGDGTSIDAVLAAELDPDWLKRTKPTPVKAPGGVDSGAGDQEGDNVPQRDPADRGEGRQGTGEQRRRPVRRSNRGTDSAHDELRKVLPSIQFVDRSEIGDDNAYGIAWNEALGVMLVANDLASYRRAIDNFTAELNEPAQLVERAVRIAFSLELAATVIDARGQLDHGLSQAQVDAMLEPQGLALKLLGVQSIDSLIRKHMRTAKQTS